MPSPDPNDRTTIERTDPRLGTVLDGKYRLEFRLAAGGFGAIYRARHIASNLELAVKIVHARLATDEGVVARFIREGETLTALRSPHTIAAYELGETPDGTLYIAMELLGGVNLFERFRIDGPLPWRRMAKIAIGVCRSLAEAHALGVVHRDLKPTNIHLERRGDDEDFVKVLDFGIAKILQHSRFDNSDLTSAGLMIGTLDYMSPEQMVAGEITGACDLYTLGIVIYEMIAGKRPFPEANTPASALAAMFKPAPPLSSTAIVPAELDRIVMRCLERDPEDRYQTADELAGDLEQLLHPSGVRPRPRTGQLDSETDEDATQITFKSGGRAVPTIMIAAVPPPAARPAPAPPPAQRAPLPLPASRSQVTSAPHAPPAPQAPPPPQAPHAPPAPRSATMQPIGPPHQRVTPGPLPAAPPPIAPLPRPLQPVITLRGVAAHSPEPRSQVDMTIPQMPGDMRAFDMAGVAQRDAMVRRLVWVCVLVAAVVIGIIAAAL